MEEIDTKAKTKLIAGESIDLKVVDPQAGDTQADGNQNLQGTERAHSLEINSLVGEHFRILAFVGSGGMGEVYKVLDERSQTIFALKMISPHLAKQKLLAKRLEHEAQAARTLVHGNIATVYEVGNTESGQPFMICDYIDGDSLEALLKQETALPAERAMGIFIQIADALVHARLKNIVHRDLKPSNILLSKTASGEDLIKIVDFGIAKITDQDGADKTKLTQTGELMGTPLYMSPEQCRGDEIDERSDIYSFGCIMHETLSGKPTFAAENPVKVILKHLQEDPPPLPTNVGIPEDLKKVIERCLEKSPADRYANARELQIDLERIQDKRPIIPHQPGARRRRKNKLLKILVAATCLLSAIIYGASLLPQGRAPQARQSTASPSSQRTETYLGKNLSQWTAYIEQYPNDPEGYFNRGYLHSLRDERTNAVDDYTEALNIKPNYIEALKRRATEYVMLAKTDLATKDADKLISLAPNSYSSFATRGWVNSAKEQYTDAISDWKMAIALDESNGYAYYQLATSYLKMGHYADAEKAIEKAISLEESAPSFYRSISGLAKLAQQKLEAGQKEILTATEDSEARGVEWSVLAYSYVLTGNMPEAQKALEQAKAVETFPARAFRLAGEVYRTAGMYDDAIKAFSSGTSLEEFPPGYRERAVTYIKLNQWRSALSDLKKSLALNPRSATTLSYLAVVEDHLGLTREADAHMKSAMDSKSKPPLVFVNQATLNLQRGEMEAALKEANKALAIDRYLKEGYEVRAQILEKLNDLKQAQSDREQAKKLFSHMDY